MRDRKGHAHCGRHRRRHRPPRLIRTYAPRMADPDSPSLHAVELIARARAAYTADGRLPLPDDISDWDIFPFEGELLIKPLADPVVPEPPRHGEVASDCS